MSKVKATLTAHDITHGKYIDQAGLTETLKNVMRIHGTNWNAMNAAQHEALEMIQLKIARILTGDADYKDHWHDIAGYAMLVEGLL